jgi:presenilin-like A22 family membrane protease
MKHTARITIILVTMFFVAQLIGIFVAHAYLPQKVVDESGEFHEVYNLPYGLDPPEDVSPVDATTSILIALAIAVLIMLTLMKFKAATFLRIWFLIVVILGISIALNAFIPLGPMYFGIPLIPTLIGIPLGILKIFHRNFIVHNLTELLIYPGIATVFIPLLSVWTVVFLLFIISAYDIYAVWHAGFMQKMAKYQIEKLKIFSGFFVPYVSGKDREKLRKAKKGDKSEKGKKIGVNIAILGGGDVVFPIILAGVVLKTLGVYEAIIIAIGATIALSYLFYISEKGKFYPAMPFISAGCLVALAVAYLFNYAHLF